MEQKNNNPKKIEHNLNPNKTPERAPKPSVPKRPDNKKGGNETR